MNMKERCFIGTIDLEGKAQGSGRGRWRQIIQLPSLAKVRKANTFVLAGILVLGLGACASGEDTSSQQGTVGYAKGFYGAVVADEPRAALVGREVLAAGGSAVDAVTAMGFALTVTLPSSAGLGGGGVCVVWDAENQKAESIDFLPRPSDRPIGVGGYAIALPGTSRGFFALHSRYGRLRWSQVVAPAEGLARFGIRVSRALARDFVAAETALLSESETRRIFGRPGGNGLLGEGDHLEQLDLAAMLGRIRARGAGDFYLGFSAAQYVEAVQSGGGAIDGGVLRDYVPKWKDPVDVPMGDNTAYFAPPPAAAGALAAEMWAMLLDDDRFQDASALERDHLLAEVSARAYGNRAGWMDRDGNSVVEVSRIVFPPRVVDLMADYSPDRHMPMSELAAPPKARAENPSAASFVALDRDGNAAACTLTLNNPFGIGRVARGTGILPAAVPDIAGRGYISLGPMFVANTHTGTFYFAGGAAGGITAPTSLIAVAANVILGEMRLDQALLRKRIHSAGDPDVVFHEQGIEDGRLQELSRRGHKTAATPTLGRVNAISCPGGLSSGNAMCRAGADPRWFGLAADGQQ